METQVRKAPRPGSRPRPPSRPRGRRRGRGTQGGRRARKGAVPRGRVRSETGSPARSPLGRRTRERAPGGGREQDRRPPCGVGRGSLEGSVGNGTGLGSPRRPGLFSCCCSRSFTWANASRSLFLLACVASFPTTAGWGAGPGFETPEGPGVTDAVPGPEPRGRRRRRHVGPADPPAARRRESQGLKSILDRKAEHASAIECRANRSGRRR